MANVANPDSIPVVDGKQFAYHAGRIYFKPSIALVATAALYLVRLLLNEFDLSQVLIIIAALLSLPSLFLYPLLTPRDSASPRRGLLPMAVAVGSFIAYGLGCYLTFYEGLWDLARLFKGFIFPSFLWSIACCVLGIVIVNGIYRLTELCRAVDEGRMIVRRSA